MTWNFDEIASLLLEGRSFATDISEDHFRRYEQPMISMAKAQTMRSAVIAQLLSGETSLSVVDRYLASGRVEFERGDGVTLLLKSSAALPLEAPLPSHDPFVPGGTVFLLPYEFANDSLRLWTVPAQPIKQNGRTRYQLLDNLTPRGEWDVTIGALPTFDGQSDEENWYNEAFGSEEEGETGLE